MHPRSTGRVAAVLALALVIPALPAAAAPAIDRPADHRLPDGADAPVECIPHPQIRITEEEGLDGFILGYEPATGQPIYRPGSGVVDGIGTAEDPYVIEGWCIPPGIPLIDEDLPRLSLQSAGIHIADTAAHVLIRDTVVTGQPAELLLPEQEVGILVDGAGNVEIRDSTITDHGNEGIYLEGVGEVMLTGNTVTQNTLNAVEVDQAGDVTVEGNEIVDNGMNAVEIDDAGDVIVTNNKLTDNVDRGVRLDDASSVTVLENTILRNNEGLDLDNAAPVNVQNNTIRDSKFDGLRIDTSQAALANNTITDNGGEGVSLDVSHVTLTDNTITNNTDDGIDLLFADQATLTDNEIVKNGDAGVRIVDPGDVTLADNNIHDNDDREGFFDDDDDGGIHVDGGQPVDARDNWWGATSGPSGGVEDACLGTDADGQGELITLDNGGEVCFDPWLQGPVSTAGAS